VGQLTCYQAFTCLVPYSLIQWFESVPYWFHCVSGSTAFYLSADLDPDPGSQTNANPDPAQILPSKLDFSMAISRVRGGGGWG
jgi:hypothetical protein